MNESVNQVFQVLKMSECEANNLTWFVLGLKPTYFINATYHYARDSSSDPSNKSWSPLENSLRACLNICWDEPSLNDAAANYFYQGSQE